MSTDTDETTPLPADWFDRVDESDDSIFYRDPRLVTHIDDATIAALTDYYREAIPPGGAVLDLMSSWISHLPAEVTYAEVVGHGMNQAELDANPRLDATLVQDLNVEPHLPFADARFDAVLIAVSVQYLTRPVAVFAEVARVLRPGARLVVATSHRCFPTKAVRAFHVLDPVDRIRLLMGCCADAGGFGNVEFVDRSPPRADPLWLVAATRDSGGRSSTTGTADE